MAGLKNGERRRALDVEPACEKSAERKKVSAAQKLK